MKTIAIIPARGGSKRIPRKNLRNFHGQPIIARTVLHAIKSNLFDEVYVSTEDVEIARISSIAGAKVINRDSKLSDDHTSTKDVISDAIQKVVPESKRENILVCCIYPVTPLLDYSRVKEAKDILLEQKPRFVFPAVASRSASERSFRLGKENFLVELDEMFLNQRSQDFESRFFDAGQFYLGAANTWMEKEAILSSSSCAIQLGKYEVFDVDDLEDWKLVEKLFALQNNLEWFETN
jgi:N-acylneuraminate cytidylyltransferase